MFSDYTIDFHHVENWNAFSYANDERKAGIGGLQYRIGSERCWYIDNCRVGSRRVDGIAHRVEHGNSSEFASSPAGRDSSDDFRAIFASFAGYGTRLRAR